ncbi:hypothetical protein DFH27DRAFT_639291 [Peziza echinospora]|nr:hypothetical protein DFH27DRAFT_639291 [Peziza echinospora]
MYAQPVSALKTVNAIAYNVRRTAKTRSKGSFLAKNFLQRAKCHGRFPEKWWMACRSMLDWENHWEVLMYLALPRSSLGIIIIHLSSYALLFGFVLSHMASRKDRSQTTGQPLKRKPPVPSHTLQFSAAAIVRAVKNRSRSETEQTLFAQAAGILDYIEPTKHSSPLCTRETRSNQVPDELSSKFVQRFQRLRSLFFDGTDLASTTNPSSTSVFISDVSETDLPSPVVPVTHDKVSPSPASRSKSKLYKHQLFPQGGSPCPKKSKRSASVARYSPRTPSTFPGASLSTLGVHSSPAGPQLAVETLPEQDIRPSPGASELDDGNVTPCDGMPPPQSSSPVLETSQKSPHLTLRHPIGPMAGIGPASLFAESSVSLQRTFAGLCTRLPHKPLITPTTNPWWGPFKKLLPKRPLIPFATFSSNPSYTTESPPPLFVSNPVSHTTPDEMPGSTIFDHNQLNSAHRSFNASALASTMHVLTEKTRNSPQTHRRKPYGRVIPPQVRRVEVPHRKLAPALRSMFTSSISLPPLPQQHPQTVKTSALPAESEQRLDTTQGETTGLLDDTNSLPLPNPPPLNYIDVMTLNELKAIIESVFAPIKTDLAELKSRQATLAPPQNLAAEAQRQARTAEI